MRDDTRQPPAEAYSLPLAAVPNIEPTVEARTYRQLFDRETLADYRRLSTDTIDRLVKGQETLVRADREPGALHAARRRGVPRP